ncbi:hypothetical protein [Streptomyces luteireticuli]|uniref:hypothetical protein n=1 Tax=Streptomyces luteireticuli TaxID=173858 RepID=UPI0031DC9702
MGGTAVGNIEDLQRVVNALMPSPERPVILPSAGAAPMLFPSGPPRVPAPAGEEQQLVAQPLQEEGAEGRRWLRWGRRARAPPCRRPPLPRQPQ